MKTSFRFDIQALRALAVMSVLIFHISPYHLPGGYLGVDVFFVISGYLIIGQIWKLICEKNFKFVDFYANRFKRLFPPLFVVLLVSSILAYYLMLPMEYKNYTEMLQASLLYYSNILFYFQSDYFSNDLKLSPLLHTWSLSVEEQFYFIFPIILVLLSTIFNRRIMVFVSLILIGLISLFAGHILLYSDAAFSFFSPFTRFWQFIIGGMVAVLPQLNISNRASFQVTTLSLLVIIVSLFIYNEDTPFPGLFAVPVTLATAAIIACHCRSKFITYLTANKAILYIGNISYSLYLWHWPTIVFYKIAFLGEYSPKDKVAVFVISFILASVTYFFVEKPTRSISTSKFRFSLIIAPITLSLAVIITFITISAVQQTRFKPEVIAYEKVMGEKGSNFREGKCFLTEDISSPSTIIESNCIIQDKDKYNILLLGDSHAAMWYSALEATQPKDITLSQATAAGCTVSPGNSKIERCDQFYDWVFTELLLNTKFDLVIVGSRWRLKDVKGFAKTIEVLKEESNNIFVIGPNIEYTQPLPWLLSHLKQDELQSFTKYDKQKQVDKEIHDLADKAGIVYYPLMDSLCTAKNKCTYLTPSGSPTLFDDDHLTQDGALMLSTDIWRKVGGILLR